jgi:hypothetical protein
MKRPKRIGRPASASNSALHFPGSCGAAIVLIYGWVP